MKELRPTEEGFVYRRVNRILNWYERKTHRTFEQGHLGYRTYFRLFVKGR